MSVKDSLLTAITQISQDRGQTLLAMALTEYLQPKQPIEAYRVNKWLNQGHRIDLEYALAIEHLTEGLVTAAELRPDIPAEFFNNLDRHRPVMNDRFEVGQKAQPAQKESTP